MAYRFFYSYTKTSAVLDATRKSSFVASARDILFKSSVLIESKPSNYKPECSMGKVKYIDLADLNFSNLASPFGGYFQMGVKNNKSIDTIPRSSYVKVEVIDDNCNLEYSIYLTDGIHQIGTANHPISENDLNASSVK